MADVRSHTVADDGKAMQRVEGRPRPGKEERRTLIIVFDILLSADVQSIDFRQKPARAVFWKTFIEDKSLL